MLPASIPYLLTAIMTIFASRIMAVSLIPPPVASTKERAASGGKGYVLVLRHFMSTLNGFSQIFFILEIITMLLAAYSKHPASLINDKFNHEVCSAGVKLYHKGSEEISLISIVPLSWPALIGLSLIIGGGVFRNRARDALGNLFKYEVSLQSSHKLITTGPYAYVRHPSYTGAATLATGLCIFLFSPETLLVECLETYALVKVVRAFIVGFCAYAATWAILSRAEEEDKLLRKEFGKQWDDWASRTRYKVIPYIY